MAHAPRRPGGCAGLRFGLGSGSVALLGGSVLVDPGGFQARLLDLAAIVELKRATGRPKDLAALPLLEATLLARGQGRAICSPAPRTWTWKPAPPVPAWGQLHPSRAEAARARASWSGAAGDAAA